MGKMIYRYRLKTTCTTRDQLYKRVLSRIDSSKLTDEELKEIKEAIEEAFIEGGRLELEIMKECKDY